MPASMRLKSLLLGLACSIGSTSLASAADDWLDRLEGVYPGTVNMKAKSPVFDKADYYRGRARVNVGSGSQGLDITLRARFDENTKDDDLGIRILAVPRGEVFTRRMSTGAPTLFGIFSSYEVFRITDSPKFKAEDPAFALRFSFGGGEISPVVSNMDIVRKDGEIVLKSNFIIPPSPNYPAGFSGTLKIRWNRDGSPGPIDDSLRIDLEMRMGPKDLEGGWKFDVEFEGERK